jgi:chromosome segregation ATPase
MESVQSDWKELEAELNIFQKQHIDYVKRLEEVEQMKKDYLVKFQKYNKKLLSLSKSIKQIDKKNNNSISNDDKTSESQEKNDEAATNENDNKTKLDNIKNKIEENLNYMRHISDTFPRPNT